MKLVFANKELQQMAYDPRYLGKWSIAIINSYRRRITQIESAITRHDLYALKSLRLEKLRGSRKDQHSMRLNDQYRLIAIIPQHA